MKSLFQLKHEINQMKTKLVFKIIQVEKQTRFVAKQGSGEKVVFHTIFEIISR